MSGITILLRRRLMTVWLWVGLFVAAVIWNFVDHQLTVQAMMQPIRFAAMDSRDTFYLSSAGSFDNAQHIHAEIAKLAAETIFDRNPEGIRRGRTSGALVQSGYDAITPRSAEQRRRFVSQAADPPEV